MVENKEDDLVVEEGNSNSKTLTMSSAEHVGSRIIMQHVPLVELTTVSNNDTQVSNAISLCNEEEKMDASDEDSSFVENTRIINKVVDLNKVVQVQQDLDFLNSSWANMVEDEDVSQGIGDGSTIQGLFCSLVFNGMQWVTGTQGFFT